VDPVVITVAPVGGELTRDEQPNLPLTPEEIGDDVARAAAAGASIVHVHARDERGAPSQRREHFAAIVDAIRSRCDIVVQTSTGGSVGMTEEERAEPLDLHPEMASLTTGTVNFGDEVFENPPPLIERFFATMRERGIMPEFECFDSGHVDTALRLVERHDTERHHLHFDLVLGVPGGMRGTPEAVAFLASLLPETATWSATGVGRTHLPVTLATIALGGHVRTGFEDNIYYRRGELATSNAQLVERVARLATEAGREVATVEETRAMLGLKGAP
jgi:3-keto-5-aminohexanoate cleavage enzyme